MPENIGYIQILDDHMYNTYIYEYINASFVLWRTHDVPGRAYANIWWSILTFFCSSLQSLYTFYNIPPITLNRSTRRHLAHPVSVRILPAWDIQPYKICGHKNATQRYYSTCNTVGRVDNAKTDSREIYKYAFIYFYGYTSMRTRCDVRRICRHTRYKLSTYLGSWFYALVV